MDSIVTVLSIAIVYTFVAATAFTYIVFRRRETLQRLEVSQKFIRDYNSERLFLASLTTVAAEDLLVALGKGEFPEKAQDYERSIKGYLDLFTFFDDVGLAVQFNTAYEPILEEYFGESVIQLYENNEQLIYAFRQIRENNNLFKSFERLVGRWSFKGTRDGSKAS